MTCTVHNTSLYLYISVSVYQCISISVYQLFTPLLPSSSNTNTGDRGVWGAEGSYGAYGPFWSYSNIAMNTTVTIQYNSCNKLLCNTLQYNTQHSFQDEMRQGVQCDSLLYFAFLFTSILLQHTQCRVIAAS